MVEKVIPSLSDLGWVSDPETVLSQLLGYYILTDGGQSIAFQGNLINLPETYYQFINDPTGMSVKMKNDLDTLLSRYFESVEVNTDIQTLSESKFGILLFASVITKDGQRVSLGRVIDMDSTGVRTVVDINNYGDGIAALKNM